jgi:hypothetical protein
LPVERRTTLVLGALVALVALQGAPLPAVAQEQRAEPFAEGSAGPTREQIDDALTRVKSDPNLATERTVRTLHWREQPERERSGWLDWLYVLGRWIGGLFDFVAQTGRVLVWIVAGVLAAMLLVYLARVYRAGIAPKMPKRFVAPSHVRDLDIRPESLPADVGAAAAALWDRGEQRAALALLYRGLLSRLVHVHGVPIRDSSTEGDCLALAAPRVTAASNDYAARLVRVWQAAVYGTARPETAVVHGLCGDFARVLDAAAERAPSAAGGAAA